MENEPLTFVPCTIHTPSGGDMPGWEAIGTGLGYSLGSNNPYADPDSWAIVHIPSGSMLSPMEAHDEQTVRETIKEIIEGKFTDWTQSQETLRSLVTREQYSVIKAILRKYEHASQSKDETEVEEIPFEINFTVLGRMRVRTTNRHRAERIVIQVLEEFDVDNPEVEDYVITSASID